MSLPFLTPVKINPLTPEEAQQCNGSFADLLWLGIIIPPLLTPLFLIVVAETLINWRERHPPAAPPPPRQE